MLIVALTRATTIRAWTVKRHPRRRADACEVRGPNPLAEASNWHRNIGALSTAIGMEFVQYEVLRIRGSPDDIAVQCILPRQKHFQHHEVSE